MTDKQKTPAQIKKEIDENNKKNDKLQKELNTLAQGAINKQIQAVEDSLVTLMQDDKFELADLKSKLKALLQKS